MTKFFGYKNIEHIIELLKYHTGDNPSGNPFAAAIINNINGDYYIYDNKIGSGDLTAHAEMELLRDFPEKNWKPEDCFIISSGEPCPMCLTAIAWVGIKEVFYLDSYKVARKKGFKFDRSAIKTNKQLKLGLIIKQIK